MVWGYHFIANLKQCSKYSSIFAGKKYIKQSTIDINKIVQNIVKELDVKPYGPTVIKHFGEDPKIAGLSMYQLIETSNLSAHFVDHTKDVYFDIFSCKEYDPILIEKFLKNTFEPEKIESTFIRR